MSLRKTCRMFITTRLVQVLPVGSWMIDPYSAAHLAEAGELIKKTLDASIVYGSTKI